jgi:hypothetical protein
MPFGRIVACPGSETVPKRGGGINLSLSQLLVIGALVLTVLSLLGIGLAGIPLLPLAVLLLCLAWLVP